MKGKTIRVLAERYGLILVYIFGSQADEGRRYLQGEDIEPVAFSDLDIAVAFQDPPLESMRVYGELYREFSKLFEPFDIDLVFIHEVNPLFQYEIIKGVRIYEKDEPLADEFEEGVMKRAEDLSFKKRTFDKDVIEAITDGYIEFEYSPNT